MRILVKIMGFGGGAPLSLLQYVKYWKKRGNEVCVLGKYSGMECLFEDEGIQTVNIPPFLKNKPLKTLISMNLTMRFIKKFKPDVMVWWTEDEAIFGKIISEKLGIATAYVFAGGKMLSYIAKILNPRPVLVFSIENKKDLLKQGYNQDRVYQISNRIEYDQSGGYEKLKNSKGIVKVLLTSRINDVLYGSILTALSIIKRYALKHNNVSLTILGKGTKEKELCNLVEEINNEIGREVIVYKGFVTDIKRYINDSTVAMGRGRSVIEPIMYGSVGIIIDEDERFCVCTEETYQNIADNNFSGRNLQVINSYEEVECLLNDLMSGEIEKKITNFELMRKKVLSDYCIEYGYDKIQKYLNDACQHQIIKRRKNFIIISLFWLYFIIFISIIRSKFFESVIE